MTEVITLKKFEDTLAKEVLNANEKYDEIFIDGDERVVLFKRTSYILGR